MNTSIDLRQFRYFLAVSEERNFGRAARRLHISQPPLSRQIRQLEEQLGVELFIRTGSGVTLTAAGEKFLPEVKRTLAQAEKAIAAARSAQDVTQGKIVIGYTTVFDRSVFPDVFSRFQQRFPQWQLITKGNHSINLVRDIRNGVMDVAFIGLHTDTAELATEVVHRESMVVALPAHHALARKRKVSFSDLSYESMFWFERPLNPGFYDYCQSFFDKLAFRPTMLPEPPDHHILLGLIAEGKGFALIPSSLRNIKRQGVVFRELKPEASTLSIGVSVAFLKSNTSPALQALLEMVRSA
ncbi:LysR family transcriptional regulator [Pantoea sp. App145]|uniref:LysR family transcriptional regulator n=1 Tax=Pantoea sp. App145 TaxID=3071567 RepID=UPI003A7F6D46